MELRGEVPHSKTVRELGPILAEHLCFRAGKEVHGLQPLFLGVNSCREAQYHSSRNNKELEQAMKQERSRRLY